MRAPLSIIIPTLHAADRIGPVLAALTEGLTTGLVRELILSDGGSDDGIAAVAEEAGALLVTGPSGRGGQLARGAEAAGGDWLLFLHADSVPRPGWAEAVAAHLRDHAGQAGYFDLRFDAKGPAAGWVAGWANRRSRWLGLPYGDQGLLINAGTYTRMGGYRPMPLMEDVEIARRLRGRLRPLGHSVVTSAERYRRNGWVRRGGQNLWLLGRYLAGADPENLAEAYRKGR